MTTRIASVVAVVLSVSAIASPALAQSYTVHAGISATAVPGGFKSTPSYDDITPGSINAVRGDQLSVQLPDLSKNDSFTSSAARHYGPRGEPLAY